MKWLNTLWLAIATLLGVVAFAMLGRSGRQQKRAEDRETGYLIDGTDKALKRADKENIKANAHKLKAKEAAKTTTKILEGVQDESLAKLISDYSRP